MNRRISLAFSVLVLFLPVLSFEVNGDDRAGVGERLQRRGDEIVACGQLYHTTTTVVLWMDPGGYDAYRLECRFVPLHQAATPPRDKSARPPANRFSLRQKDSATRRSSAFAAAGGTFPRSRR